MPSSLLAPGLAGKGKHERILESSEPALNREERQESLLAKQLDLNTIQAQNDERKSQRHLQQEINRINRTIDGKFAELLEDNPSIHIPRRTIETDKRSGRYQAAKPLFLVSSPEEASARREKDAGEAGPSQPTNAPKKLPGYPPATHRSGPPMEYGRSVSNFAIAFPIPFDESGFTSVLRWAHISFEEAVIAALGPGVNPAEARQVEAPNRIMVTVACYLLNEVLQRDLHLRELWAQLRPSIFDAIFSPNHLAAEMARRQERVLHPFHPKSMGALLREHEKDGDNNFSSEPGNAFYHGAGPQVQQLQLSLGRRQTLDREDGVLHPLPTRHAQYDQVHDFSSYCLWTEEILNAKRMNDILSKRVEDLKEVVRKSRLVLDMAGRRVDRYRKGAFFAAWASYTRRMRRFRETATVYITNARKRQLVESCFLKWRRIPLHERVTNLENEVSDLRRKLLMSDEIHQVEIAKLRAQSKELKNQMQDITLKDEALRNQMLESHAVETKGLQTALTQSVRHGSLMTKHARRWERLAKTLRPMVLCKSVPRPMMLVALELRKLEEEALSRTDLRAAFDSGARQALSSMESLLCSWVNFIMQGSPKGKRWISISGFARHLNVTGAGPPSASASPTRRSSAGPPSPTAGGPMPLPESSDSSQLGPVGLLALVRELRRLIPPEKPDLSVHLGRFFATQDGGPALGGVGRGEVPPDYDRLWGLDTGYGPATAQSLYQELSQLLHYFSAEGFLPSLLQHCPYLHLFFTPKGLRKLDNPVYMCWVLSALFVGYVQKILVLEDSIGCTPSVPYLRQPREKEFGCRVLETLAQPPADHPCSPSRVWSPVKAAGQGNANSRIASNVTVVGKNYPEYGGITMGDHGSVVPVLHPSSNQGSPLITTFRVTDLKEIDTVRDGLDTASDMGVYLGCQEEDLPESDLECDMNEIMVEIVKEEEREMNLVRLQRQKEENLKLQLQFSSCDEAAAAGIMLSMDDSTDQIDNTRLDAVSLLVKGTGAVAWYPESKRLAGEGEAADDSLNRKRISFAKVDDAGQDTTMDPANPRRAPFFWEPDDEVYFGIHEIQHVALDLEAQIVRERKRQAAEAAAYLLTVKDDVLTPEQIQFLHLVPRPSTAFDVSFSKKTNHGKKWKGGHFNSYSPKRNKLKKRRPDSSSRQSVSSSNTMGSLPNTRGSQPTESPWEETDKEPHNLYRLQKRISVMTFLKRLIRDHFHRQQWIGLVRILTSLIVRVRVLEVAPGVPDRRLWRSDNGTQPCEQSIASPRILNFASPKTRIRSGNSANMYNAAGQSPPPLNFFGDMGAAASPLRRQLGKTRAGGVPARKSGSSGSSSTPFRGAKERRRSATRRSRGSSGSENTSQHGKDSLKGGMDASSIVSLENKSTTVPAGLAHTKAGENIATQGVSLNAMLPQVQPADREEQFFERVEEYVSMKNDSEKQKRKSSSASGRRSRSSSFSRSRGGSTHSSIGTESTVSSFGTPPPVLAEALATTPTSGDPPHSLFTAETLPPCPAQTSTLPPPILAFEAPPKPPERPPLGSAHRLSPPLPPPSSPPSDGRLVESNLKGTKGPTLNPGPPPVSCPARPPTPTAPGVEEGARVARFTFPPPFGFVASGIPHSSAHSSDAPTNQFVTPSSDTLGSEGTSHRLKELRQTPEEVRTNYSNRLNNSGELSSAGSLPSGSVSRRGRTPTRPVVPIPGSSKMTMTLPLNALDSLTLHPDSSVLGTPRN